jgi:hypothetical protein
MSRVLYACARNHAFSEATERRLANICNALTPNNIARRPRHEVRVTKDLAYAVIMANTALLEENMSLLLGYLYEPSQIDWATPKNNYPDGNYALFRNSSDFLEILSDAAATRTVWYYHDDQLLVASTSQRAVIMFLGSFIFDDRVIPWVLSTGSLGPTLSWDKRLKRLQPDSALLLDKNAWSLSVSENPVQFREVKRGKREHKSHLEGKIRETIAHLKHLDLGHSVLPLSGGYDSRAILCSLAEQMSNPTGLHTVTWGLEASAQEIGGDAKVAQEVAHAMGVKHEYYYTDNAVESTDTIVERFLLASEGRIDHLAGYMDGMEIWRRFHDNEIDWVLRGDEGFGWKQVSSDLTTRLSVGCGLCGDYENLKNLSEDFGFPRQELPVELHRKDGETLFAWRDRLYHSYRMPTILAALSDIKLSYVEIVSPLLSKKILTAARSLPDNLRTDKALFKEIVEEMGPNVAFASKESAQNKREILRKASVVDVIERELQSPFATQLLGLKFIKWVSQSINREDEKSGARKQRLILLAKRALPQFIINLIFDKMVGAKVDSYVLAFRVFIIVKMSRILERDAVSASR